MFTEDVLEWKINVCQTQRLLLYYLGFIQGFEFEFWQRGCAPAEVEVGCGVVDYESGEVRFVLNKFPNQTSVEVLLIMYKLALLVISNFLYH